MVKLDNKNKFSLIFFSLLIIIIVFIGYIFRDEESFEVEKDGLKAEPLMSNVNLPLKYSRISFFNTHETRASLAIPEEWEGKYRMKETGNQVTFYYIGDSSKELELFSIIYYEYNEWENRKNSTGRRGAGTDEYLWGDTAEIKVSKYVLIIYDSNLFRASNFGFRN